MADLVFLMALWFPAVPYVALSLECAEPCFGVLIQQRLAMKLCVDAIDMVLLNKGSLRASSANCSVFLNQMAPPAWNYQFAFCHLLLF